MNSSELRDVKQHIYFKAKEEAEVVYGFLFLTLETITKAHFDITHK